MITTVVQAAAIWYDVDARGYRRDLLGRFVLDTWLPGADLATGPGDFSSFAIVPGPTVVRITSISEQELMGWDGLGSELVLLPVAADSRRQPAWVIVITNWGEQEVDPDLLLLCHVLGDLLGQVAANHARDIEKRLVGRIAQGDDSVDRLAGAVLDEIVRAVPAACGRLLTQANRDEKVRTLASAGGEWPDAASPSITAGQAILAPERLSVPVAAGPQGVAVLDLRSLGGVGFTVGQAMLAEAASLVIGAWLTGAVSFKAPYFRPVESQERLR